MKPKCRESWQDYGDFKDLLEYKADQEM